jgi:RNA-directed DNA polymerase
MARELTPMFEELSSFAHLLDAYHLAARGKRLREDVATFDYLLEGWLVRLRDQLHNGTYRPGAYRRFTIADPKPRTISAAPFRDRVVHHAITSATEPLFERRFIRDSYANRRGKGIHAALDRCTAFARRYRYALRCDIVQFFPSVDHQILKRLLWRVVRDPQVMALCEQIIDNGAQELADQYTLVTFPQDRYGAEAYRARGLPLGNQTSQFWANCYMNPLDHFVCDQLGCPAYLRYVDDFLLFSDDKAQLHAWKKAIITFLAAKLRLVLHEREATVVPVETGIPFLGFQVFPTHRRLRRRNGVAFARRLRDMAAAYQADMLASEDITPRVRSWVAHVAHGDTSHDGIWQHHILVKICPRYTLHILSNGLDAGNHLAKNNGYVAWGGHGRASSCGKDVAPPCSADGRSSYSSM